MQEFCPLCSKNGVKTRVRAYQLNNEDAVFLCSNDKCTWPVGYQKLTFFNRQIGKDWSSKWDEAASKHLQGDSDILLDFTAYTPPQTPGSEVTCKDSTCNISCTATVPNKVGDSVMLPQNNVHKPQEISTVLSKPSAISVDSNFKNNVSLKPKLVNSKSVNYKLEKFPTKGFVFIKNKENNEFTKKCTLFSNIKNDIISNSSNLKNNNSLVAKYDSKKDKLSTVDVINNKPNDGIRVLSRKKLKSGPYTKFDFNNLLKIKNSNAKKEYELNLLKCVKKENELENTFKKEGDSVKKCPITDLELTDLLPSKTTNVKIEEKPDISEGLFDYSNVDYSINNNQIELDSILNFVNSPQEPEVDQKLIENNDLDLELDELLYGFTDQINSSMKSEFENGEDYKWINSLFE